MPLGRWGNLIVGGLALIAAGVFYGLSRRDQAKGKPEEDSEGAGSSLPREPGVPGSSSPRDEENQAPRGNDEGEAGSPVTRQDSAAGPDGDAVHAVIGSFFTRSYPERISILIDLIRSGKGYPDLETKAVALGEREQLHDLLIELLSMKDSRMLAETHDRLTIFSPDGRMESKQVNHRIDTSLFKETLLYIIRDSIPVDSPLIERIVTAFDGESDLMTRMRIVRAVAKIGGARSEVFLRRVVESESDAGTPAAQEAKRRLGP